ncbi:hypothetical protein VTJ04DRAFT_4076 [Mycothermus thermophilus]|uniref:uncharacterized protein n=1 Tax=Humicola insolens TaxID=85995 RepID=UPI0037438BDD
MLHNDHKPLLPAGDANLALPNRRNMNKEKERKRRERNASLKCCSSKTLQIDETSQPIQSIQRQSQVR